MKGDIRDECRLYVCWELINCAYFHYVAIK